MNIRLDRWMVDPTKAKRLKDIVLDPIFVEAVDVLISQTKPTLHLGETAINDNAIQSAYHVGFYDAFRKLEILSEFTQEKLKDKQTPKVVPWGHIDKEKSSFD